jgi:hypothetical protein
MGGSWRADGHVKTRRHLIDPDDFELSSEMRERVDAGWRAFGQDIEYAISIAQGASTLLARRGELPFGYRRGKPSDSA